MMYKLITNVQEFVKKLNLFANILECNEVLLFKRETFLIVSSCIRIYMLHMDIYVADCDGQIRKNFKYC